MLSAGGVFGSFIVSFVAKSLFTDFLEFPLGIFGLLVLLIFSMVWDKERMEVSDKNDNRGRIAARQRSIFAIGITTVALVWLLAFITLSNQYQQYDVVKERNFYGILTVKDVTDRSVSERRLIDGTTSHGTQALPLSDSAIPMSYYRPGTGVQLVIETLARQSDLQVGIIGLGVGALAAYSRAEDFYTFYELNPLVSDFAHRYFSYLDNAKGKVDIKLGDARVRLQNEVDSGLISEFDLLIVDAFSGDQIPTHLMTLEAFFLYRQHIKAKGSIVVHISNRHLALLPVIMHHSRSLNMSLMLFETPGKGKDNDTQWVVLTNSKRVIQSPKLILRQTDLSKKNYKDVIWTDDYSSLLPILKVLN